MLKLIKKLLLDIIDKIDAGHSNISEEEAIEIIETIKRFSDTTQDFSKYSAARYLGISRATFDNYVAEGKIPKGTKKQGFKELRWYKKDLDSYRESVKK